MTAAFNVKEVATLAAAPVRSVRKAIEEGIVTVSRSRSKSPQLGLHVVPYVAVVHRVGMPLTKSSKRRILETFRTRSASEMVAAPVFIADAVVLNVPDLVDPELAVRAESYAEARSIFIETDPDILGGTPVLRGTRISVHSLAGRVADGDRIEDILDDNPDLPRRAVETAIAYANAHPLVGRPSGRPWRK